MYWIKDDVALIRGGVDIETQRFLSEWYLSIKNKFYIPHTKYGKMSLKMTCFGWHWDPTDYRYYKVRSDYDKSDVDEYPDWLSAIAEPLLEQAFPNYYPTWDIAIANWYNPAKSKLGMHVDNSEGSEVISDGHPVVSLSIGASCIFNIGGLKRSDEILDYKLNSGDVIIFGGSNRLIYHGISKVFPFDGDQTINNNLKGGRLNITLRKI